MPSRIKTQLRAVSLAEELIFLILQNYQSDLSTSEYCPSIEDVDRFINAVVCGLICQPCYELCNSLNLPEEKTERWISF